VALKPEWAKGFSRQSLALFQLGQYPAAEAAATAGLALEEGNVALRDMLRKAQVHAAGAAVIAVAAATAATLALPLPRVPLLLLPLLPHCRTDAPH
jgi:hypothetical protein